MHLIIINIILLIFVVISAESSAIYLRKLLFSSLLRAEVRGKSREKSLPSQINHYFAMAFIFNILHGAISFFIIGQGHGFNIDTLFNIVSFASSTNMQYQPLEIYSIDLAKYVFMPLMFSTFTIGMLIILKICEAVHSSPNCPKIEYDFSADYIKILFLYIVPMALIIAIIYYVVGGTFDKAADEAFIFAFQVIKIFGLNGGHYLSTDTANLHVTANPIIALLDIYFMLLFSLTILSYIRRNLSSNVGVVMLGIFITFLAIPILLSHFFSSVSPEVLQGYELRFGNTFSNLYNTVASIFCGPALTGFRTENHVINLIFMCTLFFSGAIFGSHGNGFLTLFMYLILSIFFMGFITGKVQDMFKNSISRRDIVIAMSSILVGFIFVFAGPMLFILLSQGGIDHANFTDLTFNLNSAFSNNGSSMNLNLSSAPIIKIILIIFMIAGRVTFIGFSYLLVQSFASKVPLSSYAPLTAANTFLMFVMLLLIICSSQLMFLPLFILGPIMEILA